jgi:hypothetical protein
MSGENLSKPGSRDDESLCGLRMANPGSSLTFLVRQSGGKFW